MAPKPPTPPPYPVTWQVINSYCKRLQVPGGWLVMVWDASDQRSICFLPDAGYTWELVSA